MLRPFPSVNPTIHPTAYVDVSAQVIGDVHLGAESNDEQYRLALRAESTPA